MSKMTDAMAVGRERTDEEKARRRREGDKGAKFSKGKRLCIMGGVSGCVTTFATKDNLVCEIYGDKDVCDDVEDDSWKQAGERL